MSTATIIKKVTAGAPTVNPVDALVSIGLVTTETSPAPVDAATYVGRLALAEANTAPAEAVTIGSQFADANAAPTDAKTSRAKYWLSGSTGSSGNTTNPGNANGANDGISSSQQTVPLGTATSIITSNCGVNIANGTPVLTALYRGWFVVTIPLATSVVSVVAHSTSALYADQTLFRAQGPTVGSIDHSTGDFVIDLIAAPAPMTAPIDTLAKLQSTQLTFIIQDVASGVSPATLTVDAGSIELTGVL